MPKRFVLKQVQRLLLIPAIFSILSCKSINSSKDEFVIQWNIIFSFDDGPDEHTTPELLDVLGKYEIKALFCLLGVNAEHYPELVRRIHDEGHIIINHGYSDKHAHLMNDNEFRNNLLRGEKAISSALGFDVYPKLYRPQGGYYHSRQEKICNDEGYSIVSANIRAYDAVVTSAGQKRTVNMIINKAVKEGGGIILLHDGRDSYSRRIAKLNINPDGSYNRLWIPQAVEQIITALLDRGFVFDNPDFQASILSSN